MPFSTLGEDMTRQVESMSHCSNVILEGIGAANQVTKRTAEGGESDDTYLSAHDHLKLSRD